ncbi:tail sheath [Acinetobacter phage YMC11/12/R2315]|uniref:Tail sheath protein n=10 Tax=root TaxID=1 RepID=A0A0D4DBQ2_9CAUD|nr:tail sheath [Acinetobacter phage YMC-13-01-C62]YP_009203531.1 tail sheath [Acinetobacter phage YMC11/12/R2315]AJT61404.1 hypothetical protein ABA1215_00080 [Acinetobacter phage YMC11/12/R1215]WNT46038.1 hypothetical protein [Acinetobacter phage P115]WNT46455.1 hypothetical protein [Acinetobacter phage A832.1]AID17972.1 hypothetical protein BPABA14_00580 [Acinetobacter phage YMC-13-01-C62]AJT61243.1 hypothetical protein ABA2315_00120 [Acinetobacter phage YMC11/12/R2315]
MQFNSIPASNIAAVYPAVIGGGGNPLGLNTTLFVNEAVYPNYEYFSNTLVGQHYGLESDVYKFATVYFNGFNGATTRPNSLFIATYNSDEYPATIIGGDITGTSIADLKLINGSLNIVVDGVSKNVTVDLSTANSYSDAAALIGTALTLTCVYQSTTKGFVIQSGTTGEGSTISFATGTVADKLKLTQDTGAILNNHTTQDTPETAALSAIQFSSNFVNFTYANGVFDDDALKAFATWITQQNSRFKLYTWGLDPVALGQSGASFGEWAKENTSGVVPIYGTFDKAAFFCGVSGSINYQEANGRTTTAFRSQDGLVPDVTNEADAETLVKNGYSFYGAWATANDRFQFAGNGSVTGQYKWIDNFDFQVFLRTQLQLAYMNMFQAQKTIPYNDQGIATVRAYSQDPIDQGINFGGIRAGVNLSNAQKFQVNQEAGFDAASQLFAQGWALSITLPDSQTRVARESFIIKLFYTDGSSMQRLEMTATNVQ